MNKKGSALLLALVLTMSVLPTAGVLAYIARSDLASALEDYHYTKASYAVRGAIALIEANLLSNPSGQINWPDPDVSLVIVVTEMDYSWLVIVTASCNLASAQTESEINKPSCEGEEEEDLYWEKELETN